MRKVNITLSVFVCEFIKIPPILHRQRTRGRWLMVHGLATQWGTMAHEREGGQGDRGQSHTIMLVIDMSDRAPASHTDTGEYDNSVWFWKD